MKLLFESKFLKVHWDKENATIEQKWVNGWEISDDDYKKEMLNLLEIVLEIKPTKSLIDMRFFEFVIPPELQVWIDENISLEAHKVVKYMAFVMPQDIFEKIAIEQTMTEEEGDKFESVAYFDDIERARIWLKNNLDSRKEIR